MDFKQIGIWIGNKIAYSFTFAFLFLGGIGYYLIAQYSDDAAQSRAETWRIGFTSGDPVREAFVKAVAEEAKLRGVEYKLVPTTGTEETAKMIAEGQLDFGLTVGGVEPNQGLDAHIREVMPVYVEPLHLLVKKEIFTAISENFGNLAGHTVNLSGPTTGTRIIAWELLRFARLIDGQNRMRFTPSYIPQDGLMALADRRQLPDALFLIADMPSSNVRKLAANSGYRLVDLPFHEALTLDRFKSQAPASAVDGAQSHLNKQFIYETTIPAFTYGIQPPVPHAMLKTFGTRLTFITHQGMDAAAVKHLLEVVLSPNVAQLTNPPLQRDLLLTPFEYKPHPGVAEYISASKRLTMDDIFGFFRNVLEKWGLVIGIYMLLQKLLKHAIRKKDTREEIEKYVQEVMELEKELAAIQENDNHAEELASLRARLQEIRLEMMSAYVNQNLKNPHLFDHALHAMQLADQSLARAMQKA